MYKRQVFARALRLLFPLALQPGRDPTAKVHPEAQIAEDVYIGPFSYVGKCSIGQRSKILGHVYIYSGCRIGANVTIHAGCIIGADGFGYERNETGKWEKFPHLGGVVIGDNVELHAMVHVARGTLGDTIIGEGTKVDALCHIAHNVVIGKHCIITAHTELSGGVRLGDEVWIAPNVCVREKVRIGSRAVIGMGSVVTKDVPEGTTVMGTPARPAEEFKRLLKKLSDNK